MKKYPITILIITLLTGFHLFYIQIQATHALIYSSKLNAINLSGEDNEVQYIIDNIESATQALSLNIKIIFFLLTISAVVSVINLVGLIKKKN